MAKSFGIEERKIKEILSVGTAFTYKNTPYTVLESGKPTCYTRLVICFKTMRMVPTIC